MIQPTLGLLEKLRPPVGFRTVAGLGATYSADLVACMAVLTTMDGGDGEQVRYGRVEAYRALDHLRDKVRICHQAGRVSRCDGAKYPSVALLDRVLAPIRLAGRGSFHPKVWLVRQKDEADVERFVLIVSSRNITTSMDWDLGIAIEGHPGGSGVALPRVRAFAEHALVLAGDRSRLESLGRLDEVRWVLPPHVRDLTFDFQAGGDGLRQLHGEWSTFVVAPSRVLLLSPFLDERMVREASKRWCRVPMRRLIAGTEALVSVALGREREALMALQPRQMAAASESSDPPETEAGETGEYEIEQVRALHAKVIAIDDGRRATVLVGSNNLTSMGWCGGSTEAFVRLVGDLALCEPLWDWAGAHAQVFEFPEPGMPLPTSPVLERIKDELHSILFKLQDNGPGMASHLQVLIPSKIQLPDGVHLDVARYTTPKTRVTFPSGTSAVELPCPSSDHLR